MRVTNEQATSDKICELYCPDCELSLSKPEGWKCPHGETSVRKYAADLLEARELIKEMREVIQDSKRFHVNTLENGRDRIVSLGGLCDSVEDMERGDRLVRNANAILERTKEYQ